MGGRQGIRGFPGRGPAGKNISIWISDTEIEHVYKKVGSFWLPAHNTSITKVRFGGTATLKIDYRDYRIGEPQAGMSSEVCSAEAPQGQLSERR